MPGASLRYRHSRACKPRFTFNWVDGSVWGFEEKAQGLALSKSNPGGSACTSQALPPFFADLRHPLASLRAGSNLQSCPDTKLRCGLVVPPVETGSGFLCRALPSAPALGWNCCDCRWCGVCLLPGLFERRANTLACGSVLPHWAGIFERAPPGLSPTTVITGPSGFPFQIFSRKSLQ